MKIDVHNHVIPRTALDLFARNEQYGVRIDNGRWRGGVHVDFELSPSFLDADAKLAELEARGIDAAVVSPAPPLFYYHVDPEPGATMAAEVNRGMAEFCTAAPDRLRWMAVVPLQHPERSAALLEQAAAEGAAGVEVGTSVNGYRLDEARFAPFWDTAAGLGLPVLVHPAYNHHHPGLAPYYLENVIGNMLETTISVERLICAGVLDRYPTLELVLVHGGGYFPYQAGRLRHARSVRPELDGAPDDPWRYVRRLWFDTITHDPAALRYLVERVGADRVVLGTDLPFDMAPPRPLGELDAAVDQAVFRTITEENPARLFRFPCRVEARSPSPEAGSPTDRSES